MAVPPTLVHSQPSIPSRARDHGRRAEPAQHGEATGQLGGLGRPGVDDRDLDRAERQLERRLQDAAVLDRDALRAEPQPVALAGAGLAPAARLLEQEHRAPARPGKAPVRGLRRGAGWKVAGLRPWLSM